MKKFMSVLIVLLALVTLVSCASSKAAKKDEVEVKVPVAVADVPEKDIPTFNYDVFVPEGQKQYLGVILEDVDGYTWNPQYSTYEDFYALHFMEGDVQYEKNENDGKMYYVLKFQAKSATPNLTFNCLLKKNEVPVAGVEIKISIDEKLNIKVLGAGAGPAVSTL
jgi:hypothetical protein